MTPFQCETCHFRNIYGRNPLTATDREALEFFRRASLDAFWSRASSTVRGNLTEGRRGQKFAERMRVPCLVPEMGPFPLADTMGMMCAASILDRSLDPGLTEEFVQWATFRGGRSFITNATQAGVSGLSEVVGGYEKNRVWISKSVTHSFWFSRFMEGLHKRVGEVTRQDEPISIDVLKTIEVILEAEWGEATRTDTKRQIAEMGSWFIAGFCSGLRGEEMLLIELAGTAAGLAFRSDPECPHFMMVISGRTKSNQVGGAKFSLPIAWTTEGSHLFPGKWVERLIEIMASKGETGGRLFRRKLMPARLYEFEHDFFRLIKEVQATTDFINKSMIVEDSYGMLRSLRRGMTSHAQNMRIHRDWLQTFNRWNKGHSTTGIGRMDMVDTYSSLKTLKPTLLQVTQAF